MLELPLEDLNPPTAEVLFVDQKTEKALTPNPTDIRFYIGAQIEKNTTPDDEKDQQPTPPENDQVATNETVAYQRRIMQAIQHQGIRQKQNAPYPAKIGRANPQVQNLNRTGRRNFNRSQG